MRENIYTRVIYFAMLFSMLLFPDYIISQDFKKDSIPSIENNKPELNGHNFISNSLIDGPFVNTSFILGTGLGVSTNYDMPLVIRGREVNGLFGQISYATLNVKFQQNIKKWLAFSVSADMKGRLGSQTISIITEGINFGTSINLGWMFRVHQSKKCILSSSLVISNLSVTLFNLYDFVDKIIQNGEITPDNKLVKTTNLTAGVVGLKSAFAFNRTFGCIGKVNFGYGESLSSVNRGYFDAGISFDMDFAPKLKIPIGFALGYNWNNFTQSDISITNPQNILFKVNYTGRKDFELGVEMNAQFFTLRRFSNDISIEVLFLKANIGYYF